MGSDLSKHEVMAGDPWDALAHSWSAGDAASPSRPTRINWGRDEPDIPSDDELVGDLAGKSAIDLGCGRGDNTAALAALGADAIGLDSSNVQVVRARAMWGESPSLVFHCGDAASWLPTLPAGCLHLCISVFGAFQFADPRRLLGGLVSCLAPGGKVRLTVRRPDLDGVPARADVHSTVVRFATPDGVVRRVRRWQCGIDTWPFLAHSYGLTRVHRVHLEHSLLVLAETRV